VRTAYFGNGWKKKHHTKDTKVNKGRKEGRGESLDTASEMQAELGSLDSARDDNFRLKSWSRAAVL
jgi:hypothetical protein